MTAERAAAVVLAAAALGCMIAAIAGMVTGRQSGRTGLALRATALGCFAAAVVLNVLAH